MERYGLEPEQLWLATADHPVARRSREWHAINAEIKRVYGELTSTGPAERSTTTAAAETQLGPTFQGDDEC